MSWTQVSERRWERPANGMEGFFITMENISGSLFEGRRQFTIFSRINVDLELPSPEVENALRQAWKQVRHEQPHIAVTVEGFKKIYEVPDETALQKWLDTTFIVSDNTEGETIARESRPIQQATLYYLPKTSELVIRAPHSLVDGVGMQLLWHTYLTALTSESPRTDLVSGGETARLPPSLEKALGHPDVPREEVAHKGMQIAAEAMSSMPGIDPVNRVGTVPSEPCSDCQPCCLKLTHVLLFDCTIFLLHVVKYYKFVSTGAKETMDVVIRSRRVVSSFILYGVITIRPSGVGYMFIYNGLPQYHLNTTTSRMIMSTSTVTTTTKSLLVTPEKPTTAAQDEQFQAVARGNRSGTLKLQGIPTFTDPYAQRQWMREHMAAAFRFFGKKGYNEGISGHISMRGAFSSYPPRFNSRQTD